MTLQQAALWLYTWAVAQKIRESGGPNRGPWPDMFNRAVGLNVPADPAARGFPWCTSAGYSIFAEAARQKRVANPFPRTAKAVEVWNRAPKECRDSNPAPGAWFVCDHGIEWAAELDDGGRLTDNGHGGVANAAVSGDLSANTNAAGSRDGNAIAEHAWPDGGDPAAVHGGVLVGWLHFDRAPAGLTS
jgi:hypothetical protein